MGPRGSRGALLAKIDLFHYYIASTMNPGETKEVELKRVGDQAWPRLVSSSSRPETSYYQQRLYRVEKALLFNCAVYFLFAVTMGQSWPKWYAGFLISWACFGFSLFAFYLWLGGNENINYEIAHLLSQTWYFYIAMGCSLVNIAVDFSAPMQGSSPLDSLYVFAWIAFTLTIDVVVNVSSRFRLVALIFFAGALVFNWVTYYFSREDTPIWGTSKVRIKLLLFSQIGILLSSGLKRAILDPQRIYLMIPTDFLGRTPIVAAGFIRTRELAACAFMFLSAFVKAVSWNARQPLWLVFTLYSLTVASLVKVYWRNVDWWVLRQTLCSYEPVVIFMCAIFTVYLQLHAKNVDNNTTQGVVDATAFLCLVILFVAVDSLKYRSILFRRFSFFLFPIFTAINMVSSQLEEQDAELTWRLGGIEVPGNIQSSLFSAYMQILTLSLPAISCVLTDRDQSRIALVRIKRLRPIRATSSLGQVCEGSSAESISVSGRRPSQLMHSGHTSVKVSVLSSVHSSPAHAPPATDPPGNPLALSNPSATQATKENQSPTESPVIAAKFHVSEVYRGRDLFSARHGSERPSMSIASNPKGEVDVAATEENEV